MSRTRARLPFLLSLLVAAPACESTSTELASVASVSVVPPSSEMITGQTLQLRVELRDQAGNLLGGRSVSWTTSAPSVLTVSSDGTATAVGSGRATVTATSEGVSGSAQVSVRLQASIRLSRADLSFEAMRGGADPSSEQITITNPGEAELVNLATSVTYADGAAGWLVTSLSATQAPSTLTLSPSVVGLSSGTYRARVDVTSPVADNSPQSVTVTFEVMEPPPVIQLSTERVELEAPETSLTPVGAAVNVTNGGGGGLEGLEADIVYGSGQPTGWLDASLTSAEAPSSLEVAATAGTLAPGAYQARVSVSAPDATNSPQEVTVVFTVCPRLQGCS